MKVQIVTKPGGGCPPCDKAKMDFSKLSKEKGFELQIIEEEHPIGYPQFRISKDDSSGSIMMPITRSELILRIMQEDKYRLSDNIKILIWVSIKDIENKTISKYYYNDPKLLDETYVLIQIGYDEFIRLLDE